jgi:transposase InsO family protein
LVHHKTAEAFAGEQSLQVPAWIDHYNREAPHSALNMQSPVEFYAAWLVKNKTRPVHN